MEKSIYRLIKEALNEDGMLSADFSLPKEDNGNKIRFADGAMDGIMMFHTRISSNTESEEYKQIISAIELANKGEGANAKAIIHEFAVKGHMLPYIDDVQSYIVEHKDQLNAKNIYNFAMDLILFGTKSEAVKVGMSIMELFNTNNNEEFKDVIRKFALNDEFTLYSGYLMRGWDNDNKEIFEAVKKVKGWGRVFLVNSFLEPENEEIKHWILLNGVDNEVLPNYSAIDCYTHTNLLERLEEPMTIEEYRGAASIISALLDDEPEPGISAIKDADKLLETFMQKTMQREELEAGDYSLIYRIMVYAKEQSGDFSAIYNQAKDILYSDRVLQVIKKALSQGKAVEFELARDLGIDYKEQAYHSLLEDFETNFQLAGLLMQDNYKVDDIIQLISEKLEVDKLSTGSKDEIGVGEEFSCYRTLSYLMQFLSTYPGKGIELIKPALRMPVVNCRFTALRVIEQWVEIEQKPLKTSFPELYQYLCDILPEEVREDAQKKMNELIEGILNKPQGITIQRKDE